MCVCVPLGRSVSLCIGVCAYVRLCLWTGLSLCVELCMCMCVYEPKHICAVQDVLAICGSTLPSWCSQLVFACKFLFPFDIRRRYFYCTAFGLARALHHLQQLQNAEGGSTTAADRDVTELRVGRLTRQKVHSEASSTHNSYPQCAGSTVQHTDNGDSFTIKQCVEKAH